MKKKIVFFVLILFITLGIVLYLNLDKRSLDSRKAYGIIDIRQATLAFERSGKIDKLLVDEGAIVKTGETLAMLDATDLNHQISIKEANCKAELIGLQELENGYRTEEINMAKAKVSALENSLKLAIATHERAVKLSKSNAISAQNKDEAFYHMQETKGELENAKANLRQMQEGYRSETIEAKRQSYEACIKNLDYLEYQANSQSVIKAPFDGQIRSRLKELGDVVTAQNGVFELSDIKNKRVRIYLSENQLKFIKAGQKIKLFAADGEITEAIIAFVSQTAQFTPRTVQTEELRADLVWEVRADFSDDESKFRLGQPVSVEF